MNGRYLEKADEGLAIRRADNGERFCPTAYLSQALQTSNRAGNMDALLAVVAKLGNPR